MPVNADSPRVEAWSRAIQKADWLAPSSVAEIAGIRPAKLESVLSGGRATLTDEQAAAVEKVVANLPQLNALAEAGFKGERSARKVERALKEIVEANPKTKAGRKQIADAMSGAKGKVGLGIPGSGPRAKYLKGRRGIGAPRVYPSGAAKRAAGKGGGRR